MTRRSLNNFHVPSKVPGISKRKRIHLFSCVVYRLLQQGVSRRRLGFTGSSSDMIRNKESISANKPRCRAKGRQWLEMQDVHFTHWARKKLQPFIYRRQNGRMHKTMAVHSMKNRCACLCNTVLVSRFGKKGLWLTWLSSARLCFCRTVCSQVICCLPKKRLTLEPRPAWGCK